jgi:alpha-tubulin suppressor-like RCC1 family protein
VKNDNTAWCWGYNNYGQLGDGTATQRLTPVQVTTSLGSNVSEVSAGTSNQWSNGWYYYGHSCAIKTDSTVWCWGYNGDGELGNNSTNTSYSPVQVVRSGGTPISGATSVATGGFSSCAVLDGGAVSCWGWNGYGNIGDGTTSNRLVATQALGVGGTGTLSGASEVYINSTSQPAVAGAVLTDGRLVMWGGNGNYQLGDLTTNTRYYPAIVRFP